MTKDLRSFFLRKKIISLHKKGEGYKKISKALLISQNTVAKVVQTFKKDRTATISQRRPGRPRKLTPRQECLLMRRVEENRHASSLQLSKEVESQTGVTISRDTNVLLYTEREDATILPLVVVHFSNMTMILNTHLRPLLDF